MESTFDSLVADLTRDVYRVQPKDTLQFCANWFQSRLEEQRTRTRDALATRMTPIRDLPSDHFLDTPLSPTSSGTPGPSFSHPFIERRSSATNIFTNNSPFGTLNVKGNALLHNDSRRDQSMMDAPTFRFDGDEMSPSSPLSPNPFASFGHASITPDTEDYLHPPSSTILARRTSVSAESILVDSGATDPLPVFPKTPEQLERIRTSVVKCLLFRDLDEEQQNGVLAAMREIKVEKDEVVIRQGDVGEYFYLVEDGLLHCYIRQEPLPPDWLALDASSSAADTFVQPNYHPVFGRMVADCREGSYFGELALMYGHPRAATVLSIEPSTLWSLDRITFRTIILKSAYRRRTMYEQFLASVPLLTSLGPEERSKIADALVSTVYSDGDAVVRQGDMGDTFFFVEEGEAIVKKSQDVDGERRELQVGHLRKGDYFGGAFILPANWLRVRADDARDRIVPPPPRAARGNRECDRADGCLRAEAKGRGAGRERVHTPAWASARDYGTQCGASVRTAVGYVCFLVSW